MGKREEKDGLTHTNRVIEGGFLINVYTYYPLNTDHIKSPWDRLERESARVVLQFVRGKRLKCTYFLDLVFITDFSPVLRLWIFDFVCLWTMSFAFSFGLMLLCRVIWYYHYFEQ